MACQRPKISAAFGAYTSTMCHANSACGQAPPFASTLARREIPTMAWHYLKSSPNGSTPVTRRAIQMERGKLTKNIVSIIQPTETSRAACVKNIAAYTAKDIPAKSNFFFIKSLRVIIDYLDWCLINRSSRRTNGSKAACAHKANANNGMTHR